MEWNNLYLVPIMLVSCLVVFLVSQKAFGYIKRMARPKASMTTPVITNKIAGASAFEIYAQEKRKQDLLAEQALAQIEITLAAEARAKAVEDFQKRWTVPNV